MEEKALKSLAGKLDVDQAQVLQDACELSRLASLRGSSSCRAMGLSGSAKLVICLQLAANSCNVPVDKACAFRLSGMSSKKAYQHAYKTFECLLGKQKSYTVHDLAVHFGVVEASKFAEQLLKRYQNQFVAQIQDNLNSPVYAAAALYSTCRSQKIKLDKSKLLALLSVKRTQFDRLTEEMGKIAEENLNVKNNSSKRPYGLVDRLQEAVEENCKTSKRPKLSEDSEESPKNDNYEEWKRQIIMQAAKSK